MLFHKMKTFYSYIPVHILVLIFLYKFGGLCWAYLKDCMIFLVLLPACIFTVLVCYFVVMNKYYDYAPYLMKSSWVNTCIAFANLNLYCIFHFFVTDWPQMFALSLFMLCFCPTLAFR